jgi:alpha-galactosidase/6-phospho-beta-glucosidase family protein
MLPTKIAIIGAGSASFGLNTAAALLGSERLRGSHLTLVDRNPETLNLMERLPERINRRSPCETPPRSNTRPQPP